MQIQYSHITFFVNFARFDAHKLNSTVMRSCASKGDCSWKGRVCDTHDLDEEITTPLHPILTKKRKKPETISNPKTKPKTKPKTAKEPQRSPAVDLKQRAIEQQRMREKETARTPICHPLHFGLPWVVQVS